MLNLVPRFISDQFKKNCMKGSFRGAALFVDISGFTPMTEALMKHGEEGAEVEVAVDKPWSHNHDEDYEFPLRKLSFFQAINQYRACDEYGRILSGQKTKCEHCCTNEVSFFVKEIQT